MRRKEARRREEREMKLKTGFALAGLALAVAGCGTATTVVLTDSTGIHVGTFEVADTPIPAVSYSTGPRFAAMTRKESVNGIWAKGTATITNETHALGVYDSYEVKTLTVELAEVETSVIRLAEAIQKTQKRANALGNVQIPQMQKTIKSIDEVLSEREREEFSRLKVIKAQKEKEEA